MDDLVYHYWVLDEGSRTPRPAKSLTEWADSTRMLWTDEVNGVLVRTKFHGEDPDVLTGGYREPQLLFGTLVGQEETLYATYQEAEEGHRKIVERLRQDGR